MLTEFEIDVLKEIGNMGASYSANSLSELMNQKVEIRVPEIHVLPIEKFPSIVGGEEEIVAGVLVRFGGDIEGYLMLFYKLECALKLIDILLGKKIGETQELDEMGISTLQEVGNIMSSSFANAVADFLKLKVIPTPPAFAMDMAGSLLNYLTVELGQKFEKAIFFYTDFIASPKKLVGHLFLSPDENSLNKIFRRIKELYEYD